MGAEVPEDDPLGSDSSDESDYEYEHEHDDQSNGNDADGSSIADTESDAETDEPEQGGKFWLYEVRVTYTDLYRHPFLPAYARYPSLDYMVQLQRTHGWRRRLRRRRRNHGHQSAAQVLGKVGRKEGLHRAAWPQMSGRRNHQKRKRSYA